MTDAPSHQDSSHLHTNHSNVGVVFRFQFTDPIEPIGRPMARGSPTGNESPPGLRHGLPSRGGLSVRPAMPNHFLWELRTSNDRSSQTSLQSATAPHAFSPGVRTSKRWVFIDPATDLHGAATTPVAPGLRPVEQLPHEGGATKRGLSGRERPSPRPTTRKRLIGWATTAHSTLAWAPQNLAHTEWAKARGAPGAGGGKQGRPEFAGRKAVRPDYSFFCAFLPVEWGGLLHRDSMVVCGLLYMALDGDKVSMKYSRCHDPSGSVCSGI